ncbi:methyl-accepting chemotaxis protein [Photobacterium sp. WH77]|uniref:methyl-accepting chemotaxis protein n=1 Tax=unclassified Photobacterium TaxID=2628852 RepID=UPI001EDBFF50|nr:MULTISPECIES: methyl-accepting chemotaxis protein [unclassified Photobacterium]MCG2835339.1 methyl-accepting chemotaxis protein [Photobacterium sp. WH77]MCG2842952.1 methyl-accepting chemotaxis protein [Photobacterium sp. WH80]MDO6580275.1 methyl-accepting chemotaxis protein [Photobacterium sp. 2_MG-2023]
MADMAFKPWEKGLSNIRLVPKLIVLMVFSTLLLVGKQLWDASIFYQSVIDIQKEQVREQAQKQAAMFSSLLSQGEQGQAMALAAVQAQKSVDGAYYYLVNTENGRVLGHPGAEQIKALSRSAEDGQPLGAVLSQLSSERALTLDGGKRFEFAVPLAGSAHWLVIASQSADYADSYYSAYMVQIAWQTALMILAFMVLLLGAASLMLRQTGYLADAIKRLANRDLSQPIVMNCQDEYGDLARELERTRIQLKEVIQNQRSVSGELHELADVMSMSMQETKESAQEEFHEIDQLASAMSEMTSTVQTVAEHAREASGATEGTAKQAHQGQEFVVKTIATIDQLSTDIRASAEAVTQVESRVEKIGSVIVTIQGISEQTNLLALNAAIEAARAGDAGRGFAVVADEVRNLAQRTQVATVEIQDMIGQLQDSAKQAVGLMEQSVVEAAEGVDLVTSAGGELDKIVQQVQRINDMNFQIATASEQQSAVAEEMNQNLNNVRELVEASVVVVTELTETADTMKGQSADLEQKIQAFRI